MVNAMRKIATAGITSLAFLALATGCGDVTVDVITDRDAGFDTGTGSDTGTVSDEDSGIDPDLVAAAVTVPPGFDDTPLRIEVSFHDDPAPHDPPVAMGATYVDPAIGPQKPYHLVSDQAGLEGAYFLQVVLFVEGGGTDEPEPGVDWVGNTKDPVVLGPGTGTVSAGNIPLHLAP
jgi:hypothetical protein